MNTTTAIFSALLMSFAPLLSAASAPCRAVTGPWSTPLISLYTSEGCSSCPPADRWLASFVTANPKVAALSFHVDYWDYIGWKDRFADPRFTLRQRQAVEAVGRRTVYTPQVMLAGEVQVDWRDNAEVAAALAAMRSTPAPASIQLQAQGQGDHVDVVATSSLVASAQWRQPQLVLVVYSNGLSSRVSRGENQGSVLHHERVARALYGPWPVPSGAPLLVRQSIPLPKEPGSGLGLVAIVEEAGSSQARQALDLPLATCPGTTN